FSTTVRQSSWARWSDLPLWGQHALAQDTMPQEHLSVHTFDIHIDPAVRLMMPGNFHLHVIFREGLGELRPARLQRDRLDDRPHERSHKRRFLLGSNFPQHAISFPG